MLLKSLNEIVSGLVRALLELRISYDLRGGGGRSLEPRLLDYLEQKKNNWNVHKND